MYKDVTAHHSRVIYKRLNAYTPVTLKRIPNAENTEMRLNYTTVYIHFNTRQRKSKLHSFLYMQDVIINQRRT